MRPPHHRAFNRTAARSVAWTRQRLTEADLAFLRGLPLKANIGDQAIAVHSALHPQTDCESVWLDTDTRRSLSFAAPMDHPSGVRICAFGHTRRAGVYKFRNGAPVERIGRDIELRADGHYLLNSGTVGESRTRDRRASYMMLDLQRRSVTLHHIEYDAAAPLAAKRKAGLAPPFPIAVLDRLRASARSDRDWQSFA